MRVCKSILNDIDIVFIDIEFIDMVWQSYSQRPAFPRLVTFFSLRKTDRAVPAAAAGAKTVDAAVIVLGPARPWAPAAIQPPPIPMSQETSRGVHGS